MMMPSQGIAFMYGLSWSMYLPPNSLGVTRGYWNTIDICLLVTMSLSS